MAIVVTTQNIAAASPVQLEMLDRSGAHVELTVLIGNLPPIRHAFDFTEGTVSVPLQDLKKGRHRCTVIVHAFKHRLSLNRMYDVGVGISGQVAASAQGNIPAARGNDVGFGDFVLTVA